MLCIEMFKPEELLLSKENDSKQESNFLKAIIDIKEDQEKLEKQREKKLEK